VSDVAIEPLIANRREPRLIAPPSAQRRLSVAEAYTVQDRVREALLTRGERLIGWKAGLTNAKVQAQFEMDEPVCGFLLASGVYSSGAEVPAARFAGLVVEAEVAFVMRQALAGPGVTPARALLAVEGALPALELVDFRFSGKTVGTDMIADGVFANAIVLGHALTPVMHLDLSLEGLVYEQRRLWRQQPDAQKDALPLAFRERTDGLVQQRLKRERSCHHEVSLSGRSRSDRRGTSVRPG